MHVPKSSNRQEVIDKVRTCPVCKQACNLDFHKVRKHEYVVVYCKDHYRCAVVSHVYGGTRFHQVKTYDIVFDTFGVRGRYHAQSRKHTVSIGYKQPIVPRSKRPGPWLLYTLDREIMTFSAKEFNKVFRPNDLDFFNKKCWTYSKAAGMS